MHHHLNLAWSNLGVFQSKFNSKSISIGYPSFAFLATSSTQNLNLSVTNHVHENPLTLI
jgi:hypothetical protein